MTPEIEQQQLADERNSLYFAILHVRRRLGDVTDLLANGQHSEAGHVVAGVRGYCTAVLNTLEEDEDAQAEEQLQTFDW